MQRRKVASARPSSHANNANNANIDVDDDNARGKSKAFVPRGAIGALLMLVIMAAVFVAHMPFFSGDHGGDHLPKLRLKPAQEHEGEYEGEHEELEKEEGRGGGRLFSSSLAALTAEQDEALLLSPTTKAELHVVFSTDCSPFQHWQSYLFFHSALRILQPGRITRIASGCDDEQAALETRWHETHIASKMSRRFHLHLTPHFSGVLDEHGKVTGDYKFFNKPFGLKHFLEHGEFMGTTATNATLPEMRHPNVIVILCDPDMLLLRPLTDDFSNIAETIISPRRTSVYQKLDQHVVTHGHPYAQTYGLGTQWRSFDLDQITQDPNTPAKKVDQRNGQLFYPAGPPYIGTAQDMYKIALTWSEFVPRVHKEYPHLLAEMYAYCIAAAHLQLPHMLIDSLMISSSGVGGEGWKFIKQLPPDKVCSIASSIATTINDKIHNDATTTPLLLPTRQLQHLNPHPLPSVIHYCQRYTVHKYFYAKRKIPHDIFTCDFPLLVEPPMDVGSGAYLDAYPNNKHDTSAKKELSKEKEQMEGFMVCALTKATNDAMIHFKDNHCYNHSNDIKKGNVVATVDGGNREKTFDLWIGKDTSSNTDKQ